MKVTAIIPARYASGRFPGKPLADIGGKPMIRRVYEQVIRCQRIHTVYVATDDERIYSCVEGFGGNVCMTPSDLPNGTVRCWHAYRQIVSKIGMQDVVVNVQGDEPVLDPQALCPLIDMFESKAVGIATLKKRITMPEELFDPNVVKVVAGKTGKAACFSRTPLPFQREHPWQEVSDLKSLASDWMTRVPYYKHIGLYAFRPEVLSEVVGLQPGIWETAESLEQLRWLENGFDIYVRETDYESISVDVPSDIAKILGLNILK